MSALILRTKNGCDIPETIDLEEAEALVKSGEAIHLEYAIFRYVDKPKAKKPTAKKPAAKKPAAKKSGYETKVVKADD